MYYNHCTCPAVLSGAHAPMLPALARLYPPDRLLLQAGQLAAYESDGLTAYRARPVPGPVPGHPPLPGDPAAPREGHDELIAAIRVWEGEAMAEPPMLFKLVVALGAAMLGGAGLVVLGLAL